MDKIILHPEPQGQAGLRWDSNYSDLGELSRIELYTAFHFQDFGKALRIVQKTDRSPGYKWYNTGHSFLMALLLPGACPGQSMHGAGLITLSFTPWNLL